MIVHTCEDCGKPLYEICPRCSGEGSELVYVDDSWASPQVWETCDGCNGTGWRERPCDCPQRVPAPRRTLEQLLAMNRKHKENA